MIRMVPMARKPYPVSPPTNKTEIIQELKLATAYWMQKIYPHIKGRALSGVELCVARDAFRRLSIAASNAQRWNHTKNGKASPVQVPTIGKDEFREPVSLCADEHLNPQALASIAAHLSPPRVESLPPSEAVRIAHELIVSAELYISSLPPKTTSIEAAVNDLDTRVTTVTFDEIKASNNGSTRRIPLLPPMQEKRNKGELSATAIKDSVSDFIKKGSTSVGDSDRLANHCVTVHVLCEMRWARFKEFWENQQDRGVSRRSPKPVRGDGVRKK